MNGDELARRLSERRAALPIIMISGYPFNAVPSQGNLRLMTKPVGLLKLADQIELLLAPPAL